jgi:hypothetical protein
MLQRRSAATRLRRSHVAVTRPLPPPLSTRHWVPPLFLPPCGTTPRQTPPASAPPSPPAIKGHRCAPPFFPFSLAVLSSPGEARRGSLHFSPLPLVRDGNRSVPEAISRHHPPATKPLWLTSGAAFTSMSTALVPFSSPTSKLTPASSPLAECR